ncbi:hypothetical protein ABT272_45575, partial [Streptomyces sp900105245]
MQGEKDVSGILCKSVGFIKPVTPTELTKRSVLIFSLVQWGWWVEGEAGVGEEGPGQLRVVVDAVDALFGGIGDISEV